MLTWNDLKNIKYLYKEIETLQYQIDNYKPEKIVADSVRGSSPVFPYVEHSIIIEGLEKRPKERKIDTYIENLRKAKEELLETKIDIENKIREIEDSEIRNIIRLHYIENLSYKVIMNRCGYNCEETPRIKVRNYLNNNKGAV